MCWFSAKWIVGWIDVRDLDWPLPIKNDCGFLRPCICKVIQSDLRREDFDGNGAPDLVYRNTSTGVVNVDYY